MTTSKIRHAFYYAVVAAYVFLVAGWLYRAPTTPVTNVNEPFFLQAIGLRIVFAPLCVIAVALRMRLS